MHLLQAHDVELQDVGLAPEQRAEVWRNAAVTLDGVTLDERCCFGSAADASKCARASNYLAWQTLRALRAVDAAYPPRDAGVLRWLERRRADGRDAGASESEIAEQWAVLHSFGFYIDDGAASSVSDLLFSSIVSRLRRQLDAFKAKLEVEEELSASIGSSRNSSPAAKRSPPPQSSDFD